MWRFAKGKLPAATPPLPRHRSRQQNQLSKEDRRMAGRQDRTGSGGLALGHFIGTGVTSWSMFYGTAD